MYVAAIRLYDLGLKDEATYWFYSAQYRAMLFRKLVDKPRAGSIGSTPFELGQAYDSFLQLAGAYINGYAFGDFEKLVSTLSSVQGEGRKMPALKEIFPGVAFLPESGWEEVNAEVNSGLGGMIADTKADAEKIKAQRKANGIEGKY